MGKYLARVFFLIILVALAVLTEKVFIRKSVHTAKIRDFFSEKRDYDVLAFGPSYMYVTFSPVELFRNHGVRSYMLGSPMQPINETYFFIKRALQEFKPKVVLLNANMIVFSPSQFIHKSAFVHEATDGYPICLSKYEMIYNLHTDSAIDEFIFPLIKYHMRWKGLFKDDFLTNYFKNDFCGQMFYVGGGYTNNVAKYDIDNCARGSIFAENIYWLNRISDLVESYKIKLLLVNSPRYGGTTDGRLASLHDYAAAHGIDFLDLHLEFDKTGISNNCDFHDGGHLNVYGAEKATRYIGKWLTEHYNFNTNMTAECRTWWEHEVSRYDEAKQKAIAAAKKR